MTIMDDTTLIKQFEADRDDPDAWGEPDAEPVVKKSERRQRGVVISVRLTPHELELIQAAAVRAGSTVSGHLRDLAVAEANTRGAHAGRPQQIRPWNDRAPMTAPGTWGWQGEVVEIVGSSFLKLSTVQPSGPLAGTVGR